MKQSMLAIIAILVAQTASAAESTLDNKFKFELKEITERGPRVMQQIEIGANEGRPVYYHNVLVSKVTSKCDAEGNPVAWQSNDTGLTFSIEPIATKERQPDDLKMFNVKIKFSRLLSIEARKFGNCFLEVPTVSGVNIETALSVDKDKPALIHKFGDQSGKFEMWVTTN